LEVLPPKTKSAAYRITISWDGKQKNMVISSVFDGLLSQRPAWSKKKLANSWPPHVKKKEGQLSKMSPPQKKKAPRHGAIMKAPIKT
jgi:hypothetical protein